MKRHSLIPYNKLILFSLIFNLGIIQAWSQDVQSDKKLKNSFQISGFSMIAWGGFSINYERAISQSKHYILDLEAGYGGYYYLEDIGYKTCKGPTVSAQFNNLFGSRNSFFELSLGYRYINFSKYYPTDWFNPYFPIISIGYRYQAQLNNTGTIFRFFTGSDGVGISIGLTF